MARLTIRFDEKLIAQDRTAARRAGCSASEFIREALRLHLDATDRKESLLQKARRRGLVGVVRNLPSDLSTNKKYFENFGKVSANDSSL